MTVLAAVSVAAVQEEDLRFRGSISRPRDSSQWSACALRESWLARPDLIGGGDWKLLAVLGASLGLISPIAAAVAAFVASLAQFVRLVWSRHRTIPFAPEPRFRIRDRTCDDPGPHIYNGSCAVKRPVSLIVVAAVIGLAACSSGSNDADGTTPPPNYPSSTTELGSVPAPSVDQTTTTTRAPLEPTSAPTVESTNPVDPIETAVVDGLIASRDAYLYARPPRGRRDRSTNSNARRRKPLSRLGAEERSDLVDNGWLAR